MSLTNIKVGQINAPPAVSGVTHRAYHFAPSTDDLSITVPEGAEWMAIEGNAEALVYEIHTAAAGGVELLDSRRRLAASSAMGLVPVKPGEFINISHNDGATGIGVFTLILEGASTLPRGAANLTTVDPGA